MRVRICVTLLGALAAAGCVRANGTASATDSTHADTARVATADPAAARHAIDSSDTAMAQALARGDAKAAAGQYASNAIADFPGGPILNGSDAIGKAMAEMVTGETISNAALHTDEVLTGGDLAVENGTWSWKATPKSGGKAADVKGHYLTVWQHQPDGSWKIVRDYVTADSAAK